MKNQFYAIILAGGNGERFWPLSTPRKPKQFLRIFGGKSLLQQAVERLDGLVDADHIVVITSSRLIAATRKELPQVPRENLVAEPCRCDTAAAVAAACGIVRRLGGDNAVGAVLAADQLIADPEEFRHVLGNAAMVAAASDKIVTIGVKPDHPSTSFGYIQPGARLKIASCNVREVKRFAEKPSEAVARRYLARGFWWNAGFSVWRVDTLRASFAAHAPDFSDLIAALGGAKSALAAMRIMKRFYPLLRKTSFDYAVLEKAGNLVTLSGDFGWDDVGAWTALGRHFEADENANVLHGNVTAVDTSGSVVVSEGAKVAIMGLKDIVVVTTKDSVMVCAKKRLSELKKLVAAVSK